jgi:hypothetical protein
MLNQFRRGPAWSRHEIVWQQHSERVIAHDRLGTQNCMAQPQRFGLSNENAVNIGGNDGPDLAGKLVFAALLKQVFQFRTVIEMVFDGPLGSTGDKDKLGDACLDGFFDSVLNKRCVDDRQQLFWHCLGRGQKARAHASDWENCLADLSWFERVLHSGQSHPGILVFLRFNGCDFSFPAMALGLFKLSP